MMRLLPCVLLLLGCAELTEPQGATPGGRAINRGGGVVEAAEAEAPPAPAVDPWADSEGDSPKPPAIEPVQEAPAAAEAKKERDLGKELVAAMGSATSCLKPRLEGSAPKVQISLSAQVMPGGAVLRGSVSGGGMDAEETQCMQQRLEQVRFAAPVEGAPIAASGTLVLELQP